ncbi:MAG: oxygen-dependent coproporphyrinogen oxidase [Bacteroidetes bacterium]|nr:oxygen-dependent coproporphyrinogen oxidase [Bacteroidota bacterium]MCB9043023.1 oxygen-dependent coproporphyrinogen oxidase [Chitinophagales bacterium]
MKTTKNDIQQWFQALQDDICSGLEKLDGKAQFEEDLWQREGGGGGRTRIIQNGVLLEKGGVNFSAVYGETPAAVQQAMNLPPSNFFASGVSIVIHPISPMVPIIHMNVRYFEIDDNLWWFGGGIDLTPHYVMPELAQAFHRGLKSVCNEYQLNAYSRFKEWADDYFYIKHRQETRGIGGIFFDNLNETSEKTAKNNIWEFVQAVGNAFVPLYQEQCEATRNLPYGDKEKNWQALRRGRYVEFNLVLDRGTKFGLDTNGRTESILMSLPATAAWQYKYTPQADSAEAFTQQYLRKGIDWLGITP